MTEPSSIAAIIVDGGPRSGIWFRSQEDRVRFLQHPDIVKAEGRAWSPGLGALSLQVADKDTWDWLMVGAEFSKFGMNKQRFSHWSVKTNRPSQGPI